MIRIYLTRALGALTLVIAISLIVWIVYNIFSPTEEFTGSFKTVFQLAFPIVMLLVGWKWFRSQGKGIEDISPPDLVFPELTESVKAARASMPVFLAEVDKGIDGAYIRFPLHTHGGVTEHIWGYVHFFRDGCFNVSLANTPVHAQTETEERRNVALDDVEDWQIMLPDERLRGAYSMIALFRYHESRGVKLTPQMKKQKAALIDA